MLEDLPEETFLRVRIQALRVQIEIVAARAYATAVSGVPRQSRVATKLLALLPDPTNVRWSDAYRVIKLAQYCYRRSSDVLHGRSSMVGVTFAMVDEWEQVVADLVELYAYETAGEL